MSEVQTEVVGKARSAQRFLVGSGLGTALALGAGLYAAEHIKEPAKVTGAVVTVLAAAEVTRRATNKSQALTSSIMDDPKVPDSWKDLDMAKFQRNTKLARNAPYMVPYLGALVVLSPETKDEALIMGGAAFATAACFYPVIDNGAALRQLIERAQSDTLYNRQILAKLR